MSKDLLRVKSTKILWYTTLRLPKIFAELIFEAQKYVVTEEILKEPDPKLLQWIANDTKHKNGNNGSSDQHHGHNERDTNNPSYQLKSNYDHYTHLIIPIEKIPM